MVEIHKTIRRREVADTHYSCPGEINDWDVSNVVAVMKMYMWGKRDSSTTERVKAASKDVSQVLRKGEFDSS